MAETFSVYSMKELQAVFRGQAEAVLGQGRLDLLQQEAFAFNAGITVSRDGHIHLQTRRSAQAREQSSDERDPYLQQELEKFGPLTIPDSSFVNAQIIAADQEASLRKNWQELLAHPQNEHGQFRLGKDGENNAKDLATLEGMFHRASVQMPVNAENVGGLLAKFQSTRAPDAMPGVADKRTLTALHSYFKELASLPEVKPALSAQIDESIYKAHPQYINEMLMHSAGIARQQGAQMQSIDKQTIEGLVRVANIIGLDEDTLLTLPVLEAFHEAGGISNEAAAINAARKQAGLEERPIPAQPMQKPSATITPPAMPVAPIPDGPANLGSVELQTPAPIPGQSNVILGEKEAVAVNNVLIKQGLMQEPGNQMQKHRIGPEADIALQALEAQLGVPTEAHMGNVLPRTTLAAIKALEKGGDMPAAQKAAQSEQKTIEQERANEQHKGIRPGQVPGMPKNMKELLKKGGFKKVGMASDATDVSDETLVSPTFAGTDAASQPPQPAPKGGKYI